MIPKIVFSLVFLGGQGTTYLAYFRVHEMDERFRGKPAFFAANGWSVRSTGSPDIQLGDRRIYLRGSQTTEDHRVGFLTFSSSTESAARTKLQEIIDAIKDWSDNCTYLSVAHSLVDCSPEVRESLIAAKLDQPESSEEDTDAPAPVFFDEFVPPKIALG